MTQPHNNNNDTITLSKKDVEDLKNQLKRQILDEMRDEKSYQAEQDKVRRAEEKAEHERYVTKMKESPDPWVDIIGWVQTEEGVKVELEWNNPFVEFLRQNGITGTNDEQVVQKWIVMLMRDMSDQVSEDSESEGGTFSG